MGMTVGSLMLGVSNGRERILAMNQALALIRPGGVTV
jgi:hypothetical protein